jgi:hypothetical protein
VNKTAAQKSLLSVKKGSVRPGHGCRPNSTQHGSSAAPAAERERQTESGAMACGSPGGRVALQRACPHVRLSTHDTPSCMPLIR